MNSPLESIRPNHRRTPDVPAARSGGAPRAALRTAALLSVVMGALLAAGVSLTRAQSALERITPDWNVPGGWALLGSGADASAEHVALVRGTGYVTVPTEGWATRDLFVWTTGGAIEPAYGPATGTAGDPISRLGVQMSADGSRALFGTWRQAYPQGHDLRLWERGSSQRVIFSSGTNFDLEHAAISGDGRTAAVVEVRPLTLDNRTFKEYIYRWREGGSAEPVAHWEGYHYVRGLALSADGSRLAYTIQHPPERPDWPAAGELRLVDETGADRVLFRFFGPGDWGQLAMSADGREIAVLLPSDPLELGGPLGHAWLGGSDPASQGVYVWREADPRRPITRQAAPRRLGPPLGPWSSGGPRIAADSTRVVWPASPGPGLDSAMLSFTADGGLGGVAGPAGDALASGEMAADGKHWTLWMEGGPEGRGLYRYEEVAGPTPTPSATATQAHGSTVYLPYAESPQREDLAAAAPPIGRHRAAAMRTDRARGAGAASLSQEVAPLSGDSEDILTARALIPGGGYCTAGRTHSDGLALPAAAQPSRAGGFDVFVMCADGGLEVTAKTYLGGSGFDGARSVAVGADGAVYVAGVTSSSDFPTTPGAVQTSLRGLSDGFVVKLSADLSHVEYATLLGGGNERTAEVGGPPGLDTIGGIAVAADGEAVVAGGSWHSAFTTTPGAAYPDPLPQSHERDAFLTRLSADGASLIYSTYLVFTDRFGTRAGEAFDVALDPTGRAYVAGDADADAFVLAVSAAGDAIEWSNRIGCCMETHPGIFADPGLRHSAAVALDPDGRVGVVGLAAGTDHPPTTEGATQPLLAGGLDAFVSILDPAGVYSPFITYHGGSGHDEAADLAFNNSDGVWFGGRTYSHDFPRVADGAPSEPGDGSMFDAVDCELCGNGFTVYLDRQLSEAGIGFSDLWGGELDDAVSAMDCQAGFSGHAYSRKFHGLQLNGGLYADGISVQPLVDDDGCGP